jgi:hypothetical protein
MRPRRLAGAYSRPFACASTGCRLRAQDFCSSTHSVPCRRSGSRGAHTLRARTRRDSCLLHLPTPLHLAPLNTVRPAIRPAHPRHSAACTRTLLGAHSPPVLSGPELNAARFPGGQLRARARSRRPRTPRSQTPGSTSRSSRTRTRGPPRICSSLLVSQMVITTPKSSSTSMSSVRRRQSSNPAVLNANAQTLAFRRSATSLTPRTPSSCTALRVNHDSQVTLTTQAAHHFYQARGDPAPAPWRRASGAKEHLRRRA